MRFFYISKLVDLHNFQTRYHYFVRRYTSDCYHVAELAGKWESTNLNLPYSFPEM